MKLTAAQCAHNANVSKRTIQNYIKNGKLSASRDESGYYVVDESELLRAMAIFLYQTYQSKIAKILK